MCELSGKINGCVSEEKFCKSGKSLTKEQKKERQSDIVVSETLCERMLHESQSNTFLN